MIARLDKPVLQKLVAIIIVGSGIFLLAKEFVLGAILLIIAGAALFNGARHGQWFNFVCEPDDNDINPASKPTGTMNSESKYRDYADALYQSLQEDAFYITLEKSVADPVLGREAMLQYLEFSMQEAEKYGMLFEPVGDRYGLSIWTKPQSVELEARMKDEKKQFLLKQMGSASEACYQQMVSQMSQNVTGLTDDDAWYLSIVGIKPEFQNQGLGPGLITEVLQQSDRLGLQTYLETFSTRNMSFYRRLGYETLESFFEPTTQSEYWLMARNCPDKQVGNSV